MKRFRPEGKSPIHGVYFTPVSKQITEIHYAIITNGFLRDYQNVGIPIQCTISDIQR